jgi:hypothetical protein
MQTDADDPARVRDPAIELLLRHTATLTDRWCSRRREFAALCVSDVDHPISFNQRATARTPVEGPAATSMAPTSLRSRPVAWDS